MAFVSVEYGYKAARSSAIRFPKGLRILTGAATIAAMVTISGGWIITTLGTLNATMPKLAGSHAMHLMTAPLALATVSPTQNLARQKRDSFVKAYTADAAYSNLDWRRSKVAADAIILADIGPDAVTEYVPVDPASLIELRADRVRRPEPVALAAAHPAKPANGASAQATPATLAAYAATPAASSAAMALATLQPQVGPLSLGEEADADIEEQSASNPFLAPDSIPLPGMKPAAPRRSARNLLAYAPASGATEEAPMPGLSHPLLSHAARNRIAVYDISAATVYMPNGERLEAHSGVGHMRDNPRFVHVKNRGSTPPKTYNLRMREALFHGIEAIRLLPADGKNPFNRDGFLAHTYMLARRGDSNGCVVFRDYPRFLRAFKRGEVRQMIVVASLSQASSPTRIASSR